MRNDDDIDPAIAPAIEPVRDRQHVRSTLKGRIDIEGGCVEIREFEWDRPGWVMSDTDHFYITQLISPLKGEQTLRWTHPGDGRPLSVSQFGVHAPPSPKMIAHGPGRACFLICQIEVARFRAITGAETWPDEWALRGLASASPFFKALLDRLTGEVLRPHPDSAAFVDALLIAFVMELHRVVQRDAQVEDRAALAGWQLDRVRSLVWEHGPRTPTIAEIAASCRISVRQLTRGFRAAERMSLHDYIAEARLTKARTLLADGRKSLKAVAAEAGFATPSHFSAAFRRSIGCSPSEYRANVRTA